MRLSRVVALVAGTSGALFIVSGAPAQPAAKPTAAPADPTPSAPRKVVGGTVVGDLGGATVKQDPSALPRSVIAAALTSNLKCEVQVMLRNEGAALPPEVRTVSYVLKRGGGAEITYNVSADLLRAAGAKHTATVPGVSTTSSDESFTVRAVTSVRDHRPNPKGTITNKLRCADTGPSLIVEDVVYAADCSKQVVVRNTGGDVQSRGNSATIGVGRILDGWQYDPLTTTSGLARGDVWTVNDVRSYESSRYSAMIMGGTPSSSIVEEPPARCRGTKPDFRVSLANVGVNGACYPFVTIQNLGAPLPSGIVVPVEYKRNGAVDNLRFVAESGMRTNERRDFQLRDKVGKAAVPFEISLMPPTGRIGPKVITLSCANP